MLHCKFCDLQCASFAKYADHQRGHLTLAKELHCGIPNCSQSFRQKNLLQTHLIRQHDFTSHKVIDTSSRAENSAASFICTVSTCKSEFDNFLSLKKHLYSHMRKGEKIICPYNNCIRSYHLVNSFSGHLSKDHKNEPIVTNNFMVSFQNNQDQLREACSNSLDFENFPELDSSEQNNSEETSEIVNDPEQNYLENLAIMFLKLESLKLVPISTIQTIVSELSGMYALGQDVNRIKLTEILKKERLSSDLINNVVEKFFANDLFSESLEKLDSNYKRKKFYKENFDHVAPKAIKINPSKGTFFCYVPIQSTLQLFFRDKSVKHEIQLKVPVNDTNLMQDFTDGTAFKNNEFFKNNPESLKLILYQDAFEIVNPIGSAKKKHKCLGIYMALGNLPPDIRYNSGNIKLVALCKEKEFDHKIVYGRIVRDLKKIESEGIRIEGKNLKGSLVFIAGDSLGSHSLGGYTENFSKTPYFCRFCLVNRKEFYSDGGAFRTYEPRTYEKYREALSNIGCNDLMCEGVKFDSVFNSLKYYNVCSPGLPPCLAHDTLEGFLRYDMFMLIQKLVKKKWFTWTVLNERIKNFKYTSKDKKDKPCEISITGKYKKISGDALRVFNFVRLFPLIVKNRIMNADDEVWECILLLSEIIEILFSPTINKSILPHLNQLILQFIFLRQKLFPDVKLRPKHHYLMHYPELILRYGPLIKVWTLRFESKHSYFKESQRRTKNFINVLKTLSEKHELLQSLVRHGVNYCKKEEFQNVSDFDYDFYCDGILSAIQKASLGTVMQQCVRATVKGTPYEKGTVLLMKQEAYQYNLTFGKICLFLLKENRLYIVFQKLNNEFDPHVRAYIIETTDTYECHAFSTLLNYKPISVYKLENKLFAKPDYGFVNCDL